MSLVKTKRHIINIFFVFMALLKSLGIDLRYNNKSQHIKLNASSLIKQFEVFQIPEQSWTMI